MFPSRDHRTGTVALAEYWEDQHAVWYQHVGIASTQNLLWEYNASRKSIAR